MYLNENKRLEIIKFNKKLQKLFQISIKDYQEKSGRYIIGEKNGKGKEYFLTPIPLSSKTL